MTNSFGTKTNDAKDNTDPVNDEILLAIALVDCKVQFLLELVSNGLQLKQGSMKESTQRYYINVGKVVKRHKEGNKKFFACKKVSHLCPPKRVRCIETGAVYESIREASKAFHVAGGSIANQINGRSKSCRGCHFEFVREGTDSYE